jgi:hypothetical protein
MRTLALFLALGAFACGSEEPTEPPSGNVDTSDTEDTDEPTVVESAETGGAGSGMSPDYVAITYFTFGVDEAGQVGTYLTPEGDAYPIVVEFSLAELDGTSLGTPCTIAYTTETAPTPATGTWAEGMAIAVDLPTDLVLYDDQCGSMLDEPSAHLPDTLPTMTWGVALNPLTEEDEGTLAGIFTDWTDASPYAVGSSWWAEGLDPVGPGYGFSYAVDADRRLRADGSGYLIQLLREDALLGAAAHDGFSIFYAPLADIQ